MHDNPFQRAPGATECRTWRPSGPARLVRRRSLSRLCRHRAECRYLWQLRYELLKFGLRPNASGPGAHASLRAQRKREFGDVVAVGGIEDDQQIAVARREIDLFDLNSHFLRQILSSFGSLGGILDRTDSLVGPVERTHECGHAVLRMATLRHRGPPRRAVANLWVVKRDGDAKKTAVFRKIVPADGTIAAC